ncbi:hypothetical protein HYV91_00435 [Candidatus Wolfebacteria bacterium]|nr:hypothetical protein [Candidatus Wolfebacteria bacterium]
MSDTTMKYLCPRSYCGAFLEFAFSTEEGGVSARWFWCPRCKKHYEGGLNPNGLMIIYDGEQSAAETPQTYTIKVYRERRGGYEI